MKHLHSMKAIAASLFSLLLIAACSSEDNFQAGEPVADGCQQVHFDLDNEAIVMLNATSTERDAVYTLTRNSSQGALSIPVQVHSADKGLNIPASVEFADGQTTATLVLTAPQEAAEGTSYSFDVELLGSDVNPYQEGATRFSGIVAFPKVRTARMYFSNLASDLGYFRQACYDIGGGRLCFPDFMHGGQDVWLLFDETATYTVDAVITTEPSYVEDDVTYAGCKYVYCWDENLPADDPNNGYIQFYPHGQGSVLNVTSLVFYYGDGWTAYNPVTGSGYFGIAEVNFNVKSNTTYWSGIQFSFVDPETDTTNYNEPDFGIQPPLAADGTVLDMKAQLTYNDFGFGAFEHVQAVVGNGGTSLTFQDFMHSGITFTLQPCIDGSFKIQSDYGLNEQGTWNFKADDGSWLKMWPCGKSAETVGMGFNLHSDFNQWNVTDRKIVLEVPAIYCYDYDYLMDSRDRLTLTW